MSIDLIFLLQFALSMIVWSLIAIRLSPLLDRLAWPEAMFWLTLPHAFRHVGLVFLVPGVVAETMPELSYTHIDSPVADRTVFGVDIGSAGEADLGRNAFMTAIKAAWQTELIVSEG